MESTERQEDFAECDRCRTWRTNYAPGSEFFPHFQEKSPKNICDANDHGRYSRQMNDGDRMNQHLAWPTTRTSFIANLQDVDDAAWQLFVTTYTPQLIQYCLSRGVQLADAHDIAQGIIFKIREFKYDPERGRFRAWLGTVIRNEVHLFWRKTGRLREAQIGELPEWQDKQNQPDLDWDRISKAHILETALDRIRNEFSGAVWKAFEKVSLEVIVEGDHKTYLWNDNPEPARVAKELGKNVSWIYKCKSVVLARLNQEIEFLAEDLGICQFVER